MTARIEASDIDFLIIGAAKSATTWLQKSLQADPAVSMPDPELHYFSRFYDRGPQWYFDQFPGKRDGMCVGEKSNSYLDTPASASRIKQLLPHARLIVQLRNPVDRAYSDYCMLYRRGEVDGDISKHLDVAGISRNRFLEGGCYREQLERYFDLFPAHRISVLLFEDMIGDPGNQIDRARSFLGLKPGTSPPVVEKVKDRREPMIGPRLRTALKPLKPLVRPLRSTGVFRTLRRMVARELYYPPLSHDMRSRLVDFYASDVNQLGHMLGRDLSGWLGRSQRATSLGGVAERP